jgi:hypothetical protein
MEYLPFSRKFVYDDIFDWAYHNNHDTFGREGKQCDCINCDELRAISAKTFKAKNKECCCKCKCKK